jgi:hypothetical protein
MHGRDECQKGREIGEKQNKGNLIWEFGKRKKKSSLSNIKNEESLIL